MSDYDEQYEDDFEDAELNSVANKSSPRGYPPSTASSTTAAAAAGSSSRAHAIFAPTAAEFIGDGIAVAKKSAGVRGKQSMASSFSSYESSSADPLLGQGAHELSSSWPSPTSSNGSVSAPRQHHSRARSDRPNGTDESGRSSRTGGRGRAAATKEQQQQQPASGGLTAVLPPYAAHGDDLNVITAPTTGRASGRQDAYAELGDDEDDNEGDPYRELGDAPKAQKAAAGAPYHSSAKSSPHHGYPVEARGAATASTASSGSPSPLRGRVGAKGPSHDYNHAVPGSIRSSPNRNRRDDNSSPNRNATSTNTSSSRGGPLPGAGRAAVVTAPELPPRYTTQSQSSAAASHTSRTSSTASSSSTASRGRQAGGAAVESATRWSGPSMHAIPNARDVSGERHSSDTAISGKKTALHQSNYTRVEALEDERDDAVGRLSAAEIDAAATTVSDEEHDGAAAAGGGFRANNTVSSVTALHVRAPSVRSEAYSDTFTNITTTASAKQSHISHPRSPSPSNPPSFVPAAHELEESSSVVSPDAGNGIRFNNGTNRSGVAMPLSLMTPHLANPSAPASPPRAGGDRTGVASTPTVAAPAAAAQSSATSSSASSHSTAAHSHASLATTGSPLGPASVRGNARRRQLNAAAGETLDADAHIPVAPTPTPTPPPSSSDSDTDDSTPAPASAYKTPVAQRQQRETPPSANRTPRSAQDSRSWNDDHGDADVRSEVADSTAGLDERAVLLLRITELQAEVTAWDSRIAKQRVALQTAHAAAAAAAESQPHSAEAGAGRGRRSGPTGGRRRVSSVERLPATRLNGGGAAAGRGNGRAPAGGRLAQLRAENKALEAKYARFGVEDGTGMGVQALVVRADIQLQKARERLKEVTAARRALENRDKRAAHTIEEVHRRMPTADELQQRQLNEGIYSRTGLLRTVKELRAKLERTRASTRQMEEKFTELTALVRRKRLTNMPPKEYEALCAAQEKRANAIERHKTAIAVYTNAVAQDVRQGSSAFARATPSSGSSCANSPHKAPSSRGQTPLGDPMHEEQVIAEYESSKAAQLLEQQKTLLERRQALETSIEELQRRVQQRNEQIKANHAVAGLLYLPDDPSQASSAAAAAAAYAPPYVVGGGASPGKPTPRTTVVPRTAPVANSAIADVADPVAGSGAVAARKNSLRDVLRSPTKRRHEPAPVAPAPVGPGEAASNRLRGAVAAARERRQEEAGSDAKLSGTFRDAGAGRASCRTTPPQLTALAVAAAAEEEERARRGELQDALSGKATNPVTSSSFADDHDDAGDVADAAAEEHDSIEAMLRKIDEDNRRLGQAVFGHGAGQEAEEEEEQPQQHHNTAGSRGGGSGVSGTQPSFLQELDEDDGGDDAFPEEAHRAPLPSTGPAKSGLQGRSGAQSRSSGAGGVYDTFVEELDQMSEFDDDVEDYIDDDDDGAEDAGDEGGAVGGGTAAAAGGSGRSTPEWLRED